MAHTPLVTVVIPLFNKRQTAQRAIQSVLAQRLSDWELIVVDDGSTDGSADVVALFEGDARITLVRQRNEGPGAARNAGASRARGRYLAFLDADDEWLPDFLAHLVLALEKRPTIAFACAAWYVGRNQKSSAWSYPRARATFGRWSLPRRSKLSRIKFRIDAAHSSATLIRTSEFRSFGGFYDRQRCTYGEDAFLWARMIFARRALWASPRTLVRFHVDDGALSVRRSTPYPLPPILSEVEQVLSVVPSDRRKIVRSYLRWYSGWVAQRALSEGNDAVAAEASRARGPRPMMHPSKPSVLIRTLPLSNGNYGGRCRPMRCKGCWRAWELER